ncbi:MAG TPA: hypothetical protein VKA67_03250, partial [Verrucomicrobiae bacterium]|nr:hypothetical protein [Verrucomicrobiae bacterium]
MNTPLGRAAGNWLEVKESVACLEPDVLPASCRQTHSSQPRRQDAGGTLNDLRSLVVTCAAHLLLQTKKARSLSGGREEAEKCLASGEPRKKWDEMLAAQGADLKAFNKKLSYDSTAPATAELKAARAGFVSKCDARIIGEVIRDFGGGRLTKESKINYNVGVDQLAKPGERVEKSATLCRVHAASSSQARTALAHLQTAFEISSERPARTPLIEEIIR